MSFAAWIGLTRMIEIARLSSQINGRVIEPADPEYDDARRVFVGGIDRRPAAIVRVADAGDVARVVTYARDGGVELAVRSGGHSGVGHSVTDGGIVIDLRDMRRLDIDPAGRTAWAQTGLTAKEYSDATNTHGLATGFGDTGSVGIGGITLGGGVGYLSRKYGLTIDSLIAAELVTADGKTIMVDDQTHPDLFWAIRGGGGNFGVATRFHFRLDEAGTVYGGMLMLPANAEVIESFVAAAAAAPDELSTIANVMPAPPMPFIPIEQRGNLVIFALMVCLGPLDRAERTVAPFRALATPIVDMLRPMAYPEIYPPEDPSYHPIAVTRTMYVDSLDCSAAETIVEHLNASQAMMRVAQIRVLGGEIARVPSDRTAYAHRTRPIMVNVAALYPQAEDAPRHRAWAEGLHGALTRGVPGAYVNFLADDGPSRIHEAYPGPTWERLKAIKARYDPTNMFRLNQNIGAAA